MTGSAYPQRRPAPSGRSRAARPGPTWSASGPENLLREPDCLELLVVLELPEAERTALIGQLYASERGQVLADVETDPDDLVRLRLIAALREVLAGPR
jgi:hypothetical protein